MSIDQELQGGVLSLTNGLTGPAPPFECDNSHVKMMASPINSGHSVEYGWSNGQCGQ